MQRSLPEKAITGKPHYKIVKELIKDPDKIVVFSNSHPSELVLANGFGKEPGTFAQDEMVGALRALGADYVFDVTFSADLTIMEEAPEFLSSILKGTGTTSTVYQLLSSLGKIYGEFPSG